MKPEWSAAGLAAASRKRPLPWSLLATDKGRAAVTAAFAGGDGFRSIPLPYIAAAFGYPGDDQLVRIVGTFIWQWTKATNLTRDDAQRAVRNWQIARARCQAMAHARAGYVPDTHTLADPAAAA